MKVQLTILGCGTSTGVPVAGCRCNVCCSSNVRNKRLRTSALLKVTTAGSDNPVHLVFDTGPDFRYQMIRSGTCKLDGVIYTHAHADHILGLDDLRAFNFTSRRAVPICADRNTLDELKRIFRYVFEPDENYLGGALPELDVIEVEKLTPFVVAGVEVLPLPLLHGGYEVLGFKVGRVGYLTDCSSIPDETFAHLRSLDVLILDGLRERPHPTHFTIAEAVKIATESGAKKTYLTHLSHEVDYESVNAMLIAETDGRVELAYDGLSVESVSE